MMYLLLAFTLLTSAFAGKLYFIKGKLISYSDTHVKLEVDGRKRKLPLSAVSSDFRKQLDKFLGKEIELNSTRPLE